MKNFNSFLGICFGLSVLMSLTACETGKGGGDRDRSLDIAFFRRVVHSR